MKYRRKEVVDAEQLTDELALYCLTNQRPTQLGFNVNGSYNTYTGKLSDAFVCLDGDEWSSPSTVHVGDWIIRNEDGEAFGYTNEEFKQVFEPMEEV